MDLLDQYILALVKGFSRPRKPAFLYTVMTGKRIGQAVTDIHLARLDELFGLTPFFKARYLLCANETIG